MSESRKQDHIELAFNSVPEIHLQSNSNYEPLFAAHPKDTDKIPTKLLNKDFDIPLWISSMTGGTEKAKRINLNMAKACLEFGIGMGLGSCRSLLQSDDRFDDFNLRPVLGDAPFYANLGVAQLEEEVAKDKCKGVKELITKLQADGLIIHINPLQEYFQAEGDRFQKSPLETIKNVIELVDTPIIVKEVGQGFGPKSLEALINLPLQAVEFAGFGGTNFSLLELARDNADENKTINEDFAYVGHTTKEMVSFVNKLWTENSPCKEFIISGGITTPLEGHLLMQELKPASIIGMAGSVLRHAQGEYEQLQAYLNEVRNGLLLANAYMRREN